MARRRRARRRTTKKGLKAGLTLSTVSLLAYLLFILIFAIALWLSQQASFSQIRMQQRAAKNTISTSVADQLSKTVSSYAHSLESLARDPVLIKLVGNGDRAAISKRSAELYKVFPHAIALRIFPVGIPRLDANKTPPVGYACLDLISHVDRGDKQPPIEIHSPLTKDRHLEIVRPVFNGSRLVGYLQLVIKVSAVQHWLRSVAKGYYIELVQTADGQADILIGKDGNVALRTNSISYVAVAGTRWKVSVWSKATLPVLPITIQVVFVFIFAVALIGVVVYFLRRSVSNTIRLDANNLTQLTIDTLRGNKQHDYQLFMSEFDDAAKRISEYSQTTANERERDDDPNAINFGSNDINAIDPLYMANEGVSVEEVDESAIPGDYQQQSMNQPVSHKSTPHPTQQSKAVFEGHDPSLAPAAGQSVSSVRQPLPDMPPAEIFKAYDIRGVVGTSLSPAYATLIGKAIGSAAIDRGLTKMAFARDGRLSGPELGQAFVQGVQSTGVNILDVGMVPTPVLYFAATEHTDGTGVMLTGSHNPPDYNGFKMMLGGETLSGDQIQELRTRIEKKDFSTGAGKYENQGVGKAYIDRIISDVKLTRPINVVIDCGNGVAGAIAPLLFKSMGCRVTELFCDVDGKFPNHHPDPSKPENMRDLVAAVKEKKADIGLAFDGDGDRLGVIDSNGNMIYPDRLMMLFSADVLSRHHGAQIIYDIKCSNNLTKVIWEKGGEPLMWKTGHSLIKSKMKQSGAQLAGEMSGHIFFKERWYGFDDGMYSAARLLEIISPAHESTGEIFAALPDAYNTPEINISMSEGEHHQFIDDLMMQADFGEANVTMIDGIRADFSDGWGLVRASNTTPVLVLRFEGQNQKAMERIQQTFKAQMLAVKPDLKLPF